MQLHTLFFIYLKDNCEEERVIKQYQFANWSDHDCPNPSAVLEYRRRIKAFTRNKPGPIVVHCGYVPVGLVITHSCNNFIPLN